MRDASPAATRPRRRASSRSSVSSKSSHGLAIAEKQAATIPSSLGSIRTSGGAANARGAAAAAITRRISKALPPANLHDHGLDAWIQVKALQLGERARAVGGFLLVLLETQAQLAGGAHFDT